MQVVVRHSGAVRASIVAVATLEDLWVGPVGQHKRLGLQRVVVELVEVALESELVFRPDALETLDELAAAAVSLGVVEPPLSDGSEFGLEPAGYNVDGDTAVGVVVDRSNLLGCYCRVPWAWKQGSDQLQSFGLG